MSTVWGHAHGLFEWSRRDPWHERMETVFEKHLGRACAANGLFCDETFDERRTRLGRPRFART